MPVAPRATLLAGPVAALALAAGCGFVGSGNDADVPVTSPPGSITVTSSAIRDGAAIPARFTCTGADTSPPLHWSGIPDDARSLALVVDDPDAPGGTFTHWLVYNIDPQQRSVAAGQVPAGADQAKNSAGRAAYSGPCPPSGTHRYRFTVYVLRSPLTVPPGGETSRLLSAVRAKATAQGTLTATYGRS